MPDPDKPGAEPDDGRRALGEAAEQLRQAVDAGTVPPKSAAQLAAFLKKLASQPEPSTEPTGRDDPRSGCK
jgi:hypothetical protein